MRPARETIRDGASAYFVSTQTAGRRPFFRHERWARLMITTLTHYADKDFLLHAYVIMPDHLHLLITPTESLEKSVQLIKGGFSFRAKRDLEWKFDIWQPGFTDHRIRDEEDWKRHLEYIRANPVEARLVEDSVLYEFIGFENVEFPQGLKPLRVGAVDVRAKARALQAVASTLHDRTRSAMDEAAPSGNPAFPRGLKPLRVGAEDVRAKARTLQAKARALQAEARTPRPKSDTQSQRAEVKGTGFSPSIKGASFVRALALEGEK